MTPTREQLTDLLERVEGATGADREIDALFVAVLNNAQLRPYPPSDDFGPKNRWQFWSLDGAHFLGNEGTPKFKVEPITASLDAALALLARVLPGRVVRLSISERVSTAQLTSPLRDDRARHAGSTPALALLSAMLRAMLEMTDDQ